MSLSLNIPYTTPANYTFNTDKVEVDGEAKLKDMRPAGATAAATFTSSIDLNWGDGVLTGTPSGGGVGVSGGKLDLKGGTIKYVDYDGVGNADHPQVGCIRVKYTPNFSGAPANEMHLWNIGPASTSNKSRMLLKHRLTNDFQFAVYTSAEVFIFYLNVAHTVVAGVEIEFEINYDFTTGDTKFFLDGALRATSSVVFTRDAADLVRVRVGSNRGGNLGIDAEINDFEIYDSVQHTGAYTAPTAAPIETKYATDNPTILVNSGQLMDGLDGFSEVKTVAGSDEVKYTLVVDNQDKWWSGAAWANSNGTYSEANTAAEIETNKAALDLSSGNTVKVRAYLHSADGSTRPALDSVTVSYDFFVGTPASVPNECIVYGWVFDAEGNGIVGATVSISHEPFFHGEVLILDNGKQVTTDSNGFWEISVVETASVFKEVTFTIEKSTNPSFVHRQEVAIPDLTTCNYSDL